MGLDMYLNAARDLSPYNEADKAVIGKIGRMSPVGDRSARVVPRGFKVGRIEVEAAYWRKAYHIHRWFIDNVGDSEDESREVYVPRESIQELVDRCREVLADHAKADALIPFPIGMGFGDDYYGEGYFNTLEDTVARLVPVLETFGDGWSFYYRASW